MKQPNEAQKLLVALGVHDLRLVAHNRGREASHTKRGPGRKHAQGTPPEDRKPRKIRFGESLMAAWALARSGAKPVGGAR